MSSNNIIPLFAAVDQAANEKRKAMLIEFKALVGDVGDDWPRASAKMYRLQVKRAVQGHASAAEVNLVRGDPDGS